MIYSDIRTRILCDIETSNCIALFMSKPLSFESGESSGALGSGICASGVCLRIVSVLDPQAETRKVRYRSFRMDGWMGMDG